MGIPNVIVAIALLGGTAQGRQLIAVPARHAPTSAEDEYEFVKDTRRWVAVVQGDTQSMGKLDSAGNFTADKLFLRVEKRDRPRSTDPDYAVINAPPQKGVYEFRSGRLIPGDLDAKGNFVPTVGGRIISFKDYHYGRKARKIYNLPGKFVPKEKAK